MSDITPAEEREYHRQRVLVMGLLGSIAFAGLILVLGSPERFRIGVKLSFLDFTTATMSPDEYFGSLVFMLALTSIFSVFGSMASAEVGSIRRKTRWLPRFAEMCLLVGMVSFAVVLPLLLLPVNPLFLNAFLILEGSLLVILGSLGRR